MFDFDFCDFRFCDPFSKSKCHLSDHEVTKMGGCSVVPLPCLSGEF